MSAPHQRSKCVISVDVLQNLLTAHQVNPDADDFLDRDLDAVVSAYKGFFLSVAAITPRLTGAVLGKALSGLFPGQRQLTVCLSKRLVQAFSYCGEKGRRATTGAKLPTDVGIIYQAMVGRRMGSPTPVGPTLPLEDKDGSAGKGNSRK